MKAPISLLLAALLLAACQDKPAAEPAKPVAEKSSRADSENQDQAAEETTEAEEVAEEAQDDASDSAHSGAVKQFVAASKRVKQALADGEDADKLYGKHRAEVEKILKKINEEQAKFLEGFIDKSDAERRSEQKKIAAAGLQYVDMGEAITEVAPANDYYLKLFGKHADDALKGFLELQAKDGADPISNDGALALEWDELAQRIAAWEDWEMEYPDSPRQKDARKVLTEYRHAYLFGMDNTPVADFDENGKASKLESAVDKSWARVSEKRPDSETAKLISEARKYWKARQSSDEPDLAGYSGPFKQLRQEQY